jgi:hypothetical protein
MNPKTNAGKAFVRVFGSTCVKKAKSKVVHVRDDHGRSVVLIGEPDSEADIKNRYPKTIDDLADRIRKLNLTETGLESLLNTLARSLLPNSNLSKVRKIGGR